MEIQNPLFFDGNAAPWEKMIEGVDRQILGYNQNLMMVRVQFKAGAIVKPHQHPHSQISYIASGIFEVTIDDKKAILKAGESFFAAPSAWHGVVCMEDGLIIDAFNPCREDFLKP